MEGRLSHQVVTLLREATFLVVGDRAGPCLARALTFPLRNAFCDQRGLAQPGLYALQPCRNGCRSSARGSGASSVPPCSGSARSARSRAKESRATEAVNAGHSSGSSGEHRFEVLYQGVVRLLGAFGGPGPPGQSRGRDHTARPVLPLGIRQSPLRIGVRKRKDQTQRPAVRERPARIGGQFTGALDDEALVRLRFVVDVLPHLVPGGGQFACPLSGGSIRHRRPPRPSPRTARPSRRSGPAPSRRAGSHRPILRRGTRLPAPRTPPGRRGDRGAP